VIWIVVDRKNCTTSNFCHSIISWYIVRAVTKFHGKFGPHYGNSFSGVYTSVMKSFDSKCLLLTKLHFNTGNICGNILWLGTKLERTTFLYCSYRIIPFRVNWLTLNVRWKTVYEAESLRFGGWQRHTLYLQERSKLQLPTIGTSTCWNSSKKYSHKKSVGQPSLAARWCCRYSIVGSSPKGTATMAYILNLNKPI